VSFAAITLCVASQRVFIVVVVVVVYFVIDSVRKLLDTPSYIVLKYWMDAHCSELTCNSTMQDVVKGSTSIW
jgi:hypothetical protein